MIVDVCQYCQGTKSNDHGNMCEFCDGQGAIDRHESDEDNDDDDEESALGNG